MNYKINLFSMVKFNRTLNSDLTLYLWFLSYIRKERMCHFLQIMVKTYLFVYLWAFIFWCKSVFLFFCVHREDACVSGRSLGGSRWSSPGGGGLGRAQPECREPPRTLSQRYKHVDSNLKRYFLEMCVHTHKHPSCLFVFSTYIT